MKTIKIKLYTAISAALMVLSLRLNAQSNTYLKLEYDNAGNRVLRHVISPSLILKSDSSNMRTNTDDPKLISKLDSLINVDKKDGQILKNRAANKADEIGITVYPNPTSGIVNIYTPNLKDAELLISVYDNNGKIISTINHNNLSIINLQEFADGIYHVFIKLPDQSIINYKIVKGSK